MIPAQAAISRLRRDLTLGAAIKWLLIFGVVAAMFLRRVLNLNELVLLVGFGAVWLMLSYRSAKGSRLAADSSSLIASGQFDMAEQQIEQALRSFSIFRNVKLLSIHHLAMLRHAQRRWQDSALLCRALLGQRLGPLKGVSRQSRLILADALLEMGDLRGAHDALSRLYDQRLTLPEAMNMLSVELDYQSQVGAWRQMIHNIATKVQLAELMPTASAARMQALLALAARKAGCEEWESWLRRRVELLGDVQELCTQRPVLWELWQTPERPNPSDV